MATEIRTYATDTAYEDGYQDACENTNELLGTLIEDVENYHAAYLRILQQYRAHMEHCQRQPVNKEADSLALFCQEIPTAAPQADIAVGGGGA